MIKKIMSLVILTGMLSCKTSQTTQTKATEKTTTNVVTVSQEVPDDPTIITGVFKNGMKYYIKNNGKPADKLELRLVVNAGSILEDDDQQGLAHFMEHMNFNGTTHFKKNDLVDYLQTIGVKFGADLNAYTSFDETVYMLPIPSNDEKILEKGFQIIEDWAFNALLTTKDINEERGIVIEEYRTGLGADKRMRKNYLPKILYKSKYAERLPIGKKDILENFNPDVIRRFYKDWYRPDLMAVIAVGDVNVDVLEAKMKQHFDKDNKVVNPRERKYFGEEFHKETFVAIESDKEANFGQIRLMYKNPVLKKVDNTINGAKKDLIEGLFATMINNRLGELRNSKNPPFVYGYSFNGGGYVKNSEAYQSFAMAKGTEYLPALKALLEENERVRRYGFQEGEFQRAKKSILARIDKQYENKDKQESDKLVYTMIDNYLEGEAMPSVSWEYEFMHKELPNIKLEDVNSLINHYIRKDNRVVLITGKEKTVTEQEVLDLFTQVENDKTILPYKDAKVKESLFESLPKKGSIVKEENNNALGVTILTLNNGAKVYYKKTTLKDDEVLFECESKGGTSLLSTQEFLASHLALRGLTEAGIAGLNKNDLKKFMTGKIATVRPFVGGKSEGMSGASTPKDLEILFQLINLNFTKLNKDKDAFTSFVAKQKGFLGNLLANPRYFFSNEFRKYQNEGNERFTGFPTPEEYDKTDYDLAYKIYKKRFENAADFNFFFVGNFDESKLKEFTKQYIASLPANGNKENFVDDKFFPLSGNHTKTFYKGSDPKSMVSMIYRGKSQYNTKEGLAVKALGDIMSIVLIEKLREEASGVYSPRVSANFSDVNNSYIFNISFTCGPENTDKLIAISKAEVEKMIKEGPKESDLNKAKEASLLDRKEALEKNKFWLQSISHSTFMNNDLNNIKDYNSNLKSLTVKDVQNAAKKVLSKGAVIGILLPENK